MNKMVTEINEGTYIENEITLEEHLKEWLKSYKKYSFISQNKINFKRFKKKQNKSKLLLGGEYSDNNLVFSKNDGTPKDPSTITHAFKRYAKKAGFKNI